MQIKGLRNTLSENFIYLRLLIRHNAPKIRLIYQDESNGIFASDKSENLKRRKSKLKTWQLGLQNVRDRSKLVN